MSLNPDPYLAPDAARSLLLTIDVQADFTLPGAPAEIAGTFAATPAMARLAVSFRSAKRPIIHVVRLYREDASNVDLCRRQMVLNGRGVVRPASEGSQVVDGLVPAGTRLDAALLLAGQPHQIGDREWILYKPRWGAFYQTPLESMIRELGVTTVVVCGCNFPNCPRTTVYEASERDLRVALVTDAISGLYDQGRRELENIGVSLFTTQECLGWLGAPESSYSGV